MMRALATAALVAPAPGKLGHCFVVGGERAAFASGDLLVGIEGERTAVSNASDAAAIDGGAYRFAGVFDDSQPMTLRQRHDAIHVAGMSKDVNRQDGARAGTDSGGNGGRVNVIRVAIDIDELRNGALEKHTVG